MKLSSIRIESMIDYPGKFGPVLFTLGCNFNCGFCHNAQQVEEMPQQHIKDLLEKVIKNPWYNGLCICGGEPTIHADLPEFLQEIKKYGVSVKLDTNGSNPKILKEILEKGLVDYIAMDVKGPKSLYTKIIKEPGYEPAIEQSMHIVSQFPQYEFRTTVAPILKNGKTGFLSIEDIAETAKWISGIANKNYTLYYLQKFLPIKGKLADKSLESFTETPDDLLKDMKEKAQKYLPLTEIR